MSSLAAWMFALTVAVCATILAAGANQPALHMAATGIVCVAIAVMAIREHHQLIRRRRPGQHHCQFYRPLSRSHLGLGRAGAGCDLPLDPRNPLARVVAVLYRLCLCGSCEHRLLQHARPRYGGRTAERHAREGRPPPRSGAACRHGGRDHKPSDRSQVPPRYGSRRLGRMQYLLLWSARDRRRQSRRFTISGARVMQLQFAPF